MRLSLWGTRALHGDVDVDVALRLAVPEADHRAGGATTLRAWAELGERVVLVALPRPGDLTGLPRGGPELVAAAVEAGECVFVPGVGGALVPVLGSYGPDGDEGTSVAWHDFDAAPVATHVVEALSLRDAERRLTAATAETVQILESCSAQPWASRGLRDLVDERLGDAPLGLPAGLAPRALRVIGLAGLIGALARLGLDSPDDSLAAAGADTRRRALRELRAVGDRCLAEATCVAALTLAGLRGDRTD